MTHLQRSVLRSFLSFSLLCTTGCSAMMAASGNETPDLSVLQTGTPKKDVEGVFGRPLSAIRTNTGDLVTYQYFDADPPNYRRAGVNALLAAFTLGFSELILSPVEAVQGDRHVVTVTYGLDQRLRSSFSHTVSAPVEAPERLVGLEKELAPERPIDTRTARLPTSGT